MKKLFFFLISIAAVSCKEDTKIQPDSNQLTGTIWTKHYFDYPNGRKLYKVLKFVNDKQVKINFLMDKKDIYASVGFMDYQKQGQMFWVLNSDNTVTDGHIFSDRLEFNAEVYEKDQ
jgi:hypothetical protein